MRPVNVMHLITGLEVGGAEMMLKRLAIATDPRRCRVSVLSLLEPGPVGAALMSAGVPVHSLRMKRAVPDPRALPRLVGLLRRERCDVLQTWLYHADFLGIVASRLAGVPRLAWNLRGADTDAPQCSPMIVVLRRILSRLSRWPDLVIVNSAAGKATHEGLGYRPRRWEIIPNGIDPTEFKPDHEARRRLQRELGLPESAFLVCLPARVDPQKDHDTFFRAAARLGATYDDAHFIVVGRGTDDPALQNRAKALGADGRMRFLGQRQNMASLLSGVDLVTLSSSFGEGCPNVLIEAMGCGVPVAATDVGDAAEMIADPRLVARPGDAEGLSEAWAVIREMGSDGRRALGETLRQRVLDRYDLAKIVRRYEALYEEMAGSGANVRGRP